jgi:hypothetical protein
MSLELVLALAGRVSLPVVIDLLVSEHHVGQPVLVPKVEIGGFHAGDGRAEGTMRPRAIGAKKDSEIE